MRTKILSAAALIIFALSICGCGENQADAEITWGRADAKEIDVNSKIAGRVVELLVQEGDAVEKGAVLANIDKRDLMAQKAQLEANIAAIQAQQMQAAALTEMQRQTLNAALAQAKSVEEKARADLELCRSDYRRYSELVQSGAVSQKVFEEYQTKFNVAEAAFAQSAAAVEQAQAALLQTNVNLASEKALEKKSGAGAGGVRPAGSFARRDGNSRAVRRNNHREIRRGRLNDFTGHAARRNSRPAR